MKVVTRSRKVILILCAGLLVVSMVILALFNIMSAKEAPEVTYKETSVKSGNLTVGVTESGSVKIGAVTQAFDLSLTSAASTSSSSSAASSSAAASSSSSSSSAVKASSATGTAAAGSTTATGTSSAASTGSSSTSLVVESVLVASGQIVKAGDPLLTLTAASITTVRDTLAAAITSASLAVTKAEIERDTAALQATYTYKANKALGTTAKSEYNASITALDLAVKSAQDGVDEADERLAAIPGEIQALQDQLDALDKQAASYVSASSELEREIQTLTTEQANYTSKYDSLTSQLGKVTREKTTGAITAKEKYDESMVTYSNADVLYAIDMDGIDDDITSAEETLATTRDNLQNFEDFVGNGTILSDYSGTLTAVGYTAGDSLTASTAIATFQNADAVTLSISVAQDDISVVAVGNVVNIEFTAYEDKIYHGTVTAISSSTSNSRSTTVSYPVTVKVSGDVSLIYAGMTGNVTFVTKEVQNVLYVSNKAIIQDGTKSYVKKRNAAGTISSVEVTTGFSDGYQVAITSGLAEGDVVLIESKVSGT